MKLAKKWENNAKFFFAKFREKASILRERMRCEKMRNFRRNNFFYRLQKMPK